MATWPQDEDFDDDVYDEYDWGLEIDVDPDDDLLGLDDDDMPDDFFNDDWDDSTPY